MGMTMTIGKTRKPPRKATGGKKSAPSHQRPLLTGEQARAALDNAGTSIAQFARQHELPSQTVYQVLAGRKAGRYGNAHKAAVLLGMKRGVIVCDG